jgi:hypothetical protein
VLKILIDNDNSQIRLLDLVIKVTGRLTVQNRSLGGREELKSGGWDFKSGRTTFQEWKTRFQEWKITFKNGG